MGKRESGAAHESQSQSQTQRPKSARVGLPAPLPLTPLFLPSTDSNGKHKREGEERNGGWKMEGCHIHGLVRQGTGRHDAMGAGRGEGGVTASAVVNYANGRFCLIRPK